MALWIGNGRDNQEGYLLYSVAEQAGARFGQDERETIVHPQIATNTCSTHGDYKNVHGKMKSFINVVLVQVSIHLYDAVGGSFDFVKVSSPSLLPQVHGCDTYLVDILMENIVNNDMHGVPLGLDH